MCFGTKKEKIPSEKIDESRRVSPSLYFETRKLVFLGLIEELDLLKNVFISNGYPEPLVLKTLRESWPRETLKAVLK